MAEFDIGETVEVVGQGEVGRITGKGRPFGFHSRTITYEVTFRSGLTSFYEAHGLKPVKKKAEEDKAMITPLFKAFEDIKAIIKTGKWNLIETVIKHDYHEEADKQYITLDIVIKRRNGENK